MPLRIIDEGYEHWGVYVGGFTIAPDVLLIRAESFDTAWEAMTEEFADRGSIVVCDGPEPECRGENGPCEGCEFVDMHGGPYVTLDLTLRVVRPGRSD